jgi:hypothetical protein
MGIYLREALSPSFPSSGSFQANESISIIQAFSICQILVQLFPKFICQLGNFIGYGYLHSVILLKPSCRLHRCLWWILSAPGLKHGGPADEKGLDGPGQSIAYLFEELVHFLLSRNSLRV